MGCGVETGAYGVIVEIEIIYTPICLNNVEIKMANDTEDNKPSLIKCGVNDCSAINVNWGSQTVVQ